MLVVRVLNYVLTKSSKFQWFCFIVLSCILLLGIAWQQFSGFSRKHNELLHQHKYQTTKNIQLTDKLNILKNNNRSNKTVLSNAEIADMLERWSDDKETSITAINFYEENYNSSFNLVRTHVDTVTTMQGLYSLLDSVIGQSLFLHSIVVKSHTPTTIELRLQLIQPVKKST